MRKVRPFKITIELLFFLVETIVQKLERNQTNEEAQKLLIPLERCFRVLEMVSGQFF